MQKKIKKSKRIFSVLSVFLVMIFCLVGGFNSASSRLNGRIYGFSRLKSGVAVSAESKYGDEILLSPGGMSFGVRLSTKGVIVVGFSRGSQGGQSPAEEAGLHTKDIIIGINGKTVNTAAEVISYIEGCKGKPVELTVLRGEEECDITVTPKIDGDDGVYKAGIWVRDSTAGIGTVTVIDPETGRFAGLGHAICDSDTGIVMPLRKGSVYDISIASVRKGKAGAPGELKGYFSSSVSGVLFNNTEAGVSGKFSKLDKNRLSEPLPIASRNEVEVGEAYIYSTLEGSNIGKYRVEIKKITDPVGKSKNFIIEVTDSTLLEITGGIVQGMSGSPIIQNGKIIGAVTHVMVNEPTRGYGIFIDNMLEIMS